MSGSDLCVTIPPAYTPVDIPQQRPHETFRIALAPSCVCLCHPGLAGPREKNKRQRAYKLFACWRVQYFLRREANMVKMAFADDFLPWRRYVGQHRTCVPQMSSSGSNAPPQSPLQKLNEWTDSVNLTTPMRPNTTLPYLYQFELTTLQEGLIHVLTLHRRLEREHDALVAIRQTQYPDTNATFQFAFRFVDRLITTGQPGLVADPDLWMAQICMAGNEGDIRMFRTEWNRWRDLKGVEEREKTGSMFRHSIEVLTRINWVMRERVVALRWALGVAQGDVDDGRMVNWWQFERRR